jgi:peptide/nickel transport system substrate-binding protein
MDRFPLAIGRRLILQFAGSSAALSLFDLATGSMAPAAEPKRGGKLTHADCYMVNRAGESTNGRNPRYIPTLNTRPFWNCLTWVNNELGVEPELATRWSASDDQKVWEFDLRDDVMFHDGRHMTSADVEASFRYHITWAYYAKLMIQSVEATGPYKIRFSLYQGASEFPWILSEYDHWVMPKMPVEDYQKDTSAVGTGPFKLVAVDNRRGMRGERFENYFVKGHPFVDEYELVLTSSQASLNGFRTGQFKFSTDIDPALAPQYEAAGGVVSEVAGYQPWMGLDKTDSGFFKDKRIRQALALAIDREAINRIVYRAPNAPVANDTLLSTADPNFLPWPGRNVAKAKELLAAAGHPNGIKLPTLYYILAYPESSRMFQLLAQSVKEAGIDLPVEERPADGFSAWAQGEKTNPGRLYITISGNRHTAATLARMVRGMTTVDGWSGDGYERFLALYSKVQVTADPGERRALYHDIQRLMWDEVPVLVPISRRTMLVHAKDTNGLSAQTQHWTYKWQDAWIG